jgi:hypothetical protein
MQAPAQPAVPGPEPVMPDEPTSSPTSPPASQPAAPDPEPMGPDTPEPEPVGDPQFPEPSAIVIEGCGVVGGYDRVFIFQRDAATGICTDFGLVTPVDAGGQVPFALSNLSLPMRWTVEDMVSFACAVDGSALSSATPTYFTRAEGDITFGAMQGNLPRQVKLDVVLSEPALDAGTLADQTIPEQRLVADEIDLLQGCSLR